MRAATVLDDTLLHDTYLSSILVAWPLAEFFHSLLSHVVCLSSKKHFQCQSFPRSTMRFTIHISSVVVMALPFFASAADLKFMVLPQTTKYNEDHNAACVSHFGEGARIADWQKDISTLSSGDLSTMMTDQGIAKGSGSYWVTLNGKQKVRF